LCFALSAEMIGSRRNKMAKTNEDRNAEKQMDPEVLIEEFNQGCGACS